MLKFSLWMIRPRVLHRVTAPRSRGWTSVPNPLYLPPPNLRTLATQPQREWCGRWRLNFGRWLAAGSIQRRGDDTSPCVNCGELTTSDQCGGRLTALTVDSWRISGYRRLSDSVRHAPLLLLLLLLLLPQTPVMRCLLASNSLLRQPATPTAATKSTRHLEDITSINLIDNVT